MANLLLKSKSDVRKRQNSVTTSSRSTKLYMQIHQLAGQRKYTAYDGAQKPQPCHHAPSLRCELTICWSQVRRPNRYATKLPGL